MADDIIICRCEDMTRQALLDVIAEGYETIDEIKRVTRAGMGPCQGRTCRQLIAGELSDDLPGLFGHGMVVVFVAFGRPPDLSGSSFLGGLVIDDVLVFRGAAGENAGHDVDSAEFGHLPFVKALETGLGLLVVKDFVGRVVDDLGNAGDTVL